MCGIAGLFNLNKAPVHEEYLKRMNTCLAHRGPDDEGYLIDENVGLAHKRLAIIDLSFQAHQPMYNEDKSACIIHNGEIFNYLEIMDILKGRGHIFKSHSDTEVILHAFEEWGASCVTRFNGMWSFVIWDRKKRSLFCSRDRFGIKPFYYFSDGTKFVFASEIKAIFANDDIEKIANERAIYRYLSRGYGYMDTGEETFFSGIKQLEAGSSLFVSSENIHKRKYWSINTKHKLDGFEIERGKDKFLFLLKDSIRLNLRSDVPVSIALSGGLDSSSLAVLLPEFATEKVNTFSACFEYKEYDERPYINEILKEKTYVPHFVYPNVRTLISDFEKIVWHQDEPYSGASVFSQWELMKKVKEKGIKVLLTGQGGDELLAGYDKFYPFFLADLLKECRFGDFIGDLNSMSASMGCSKTCLFMLIMKILSAGLIRGKLKRNLLPKQRPSFLKKGFFERNYKTENYKIKKSNSYLDNELYDSLTVSPLPSLLHIDDRNSMAHSIESRPPLLDYRLVEFLFSLPHDAKISNGQNKYILRYALKGNLPEKIRLRTDKKGFATPAKIWFGKELKNMVLELLHSHDCKKRGILDPKGVDTILKLHFDGKKDYAFTIWSWINLEIWFKVFFNGTA